MPGSKEQQAPDMAWHAREGLQPDFVEARLRHYLAGRAPAPGGSLKFTNRIAFIGNPELCADLQCFAQVEPLHPGGDDTAPADLLLIGGDWPRAGDPWREALLDAQPDAAARLRETIARYRSRGVPCTLWITDEAGAANALLHLADAVDAVFVPRGVDVAGAGTLDACVNVKLFNPFSENAVSQTDASCFRFAIDGVHELSQLAASETALELVKPFLKFNSWLIDSSYHYQIANMKLPAACRRRFIGHLGPGERAALLKMAHGLYLPSALAAARPMTFRKRALEAQASKTPVLSDGADEDGILRFQGADQLATLLTWLLDDEVGRVGHAHRAWRQAVSRHTFFERLETIFAAVKVKPAYNQMPRPRINVVMPTLRPDYIPFALDMFRRQSWDEATLTVVANGVEVPEHVSRAISETPGAQLCFVPADKTIGYCVNFGIDRAEADYWAKWDDDDIYGPHFLEDQMLQRKYLDFDISGKAAIFNYIEESDGVFTRDFAIRDTASRHLGGGTLVVRDGGRYFAEDGRGSEDRAFLHLARERGDRIVSGDPFNFMQIRRRDAFTHTWALGPRPQDLSGPLRRGLSLEGVIL